MEQGVETVGLGAQRGIGARQRIGRPRQRQLRRRQVDQRRGASGPRGERVEIVLLRARELTALKAGETGEEGVFRPLETAAVVRIGHRARR
jgi:hypothetical protein